MIGLKMNVDIRLNLLIMIVLDVSFFPSSSAQTIPNKFTCKFLFITILYFMEIESSFEVNLVHLVARHLFLLALTADQNAWILVLNSCCVYVELSRYACAQKLSN